MGPSAEADEDLLRALTTKGWCFADVNAIKQLMGRCTTVDSIESELVNMDLRSIGGKSLPEPSLLRKASHLQCPKILQISSVRDISRSSLAEISVNSDSKRLLRLKLTDGHSEITAVECSPVPSIPDDVIPGTKVELHNKADVCNGIVCLNSKIITILGGTVPSLYEEWQMKRRYMGSGRSSTGLLHQVVAGGPPPFEKLQLQASVQGIARESSKLGQTIRPEENYPTASSVNNDVKLRDIVDKSMEKPASADTRPKVAASVPVHNQAAAQKLLQRTSQPNYDNRHSRGQRHRGKGKQEESHVLTLEEWERTKTQAKQEEPCVLTLDEWEHRKSGVSLSMKCEPSGISQDEDLARLLQEQFDLEDIQGQKGPNRMEADDIKISMFSFQRDNVGALHRTGFRERGRGRRSRGRGRS